MVFAYHNLPWELPAFDGVEATVERVTLPSQYPLKVEFIDQGRACLCRVEYAQGVLSADDARALQSAIRYHLAALGESLRNN